MRKCKFRGQGVLTTAIVNGPRACSTGGGGRGGEVAGARRGGSELISNQAGADPLKGLERWEKQAGPCCVPLWLCPIWEKAREPLAGASPRVHRPGCSGRCRGTRLQPPAVCTGLWALRGHLLQPLCDSGSRGISHPVQGDAREGLFVPMRCTKSFLLATVRSGNYHSLYSTGGETEAGGMTCPGRTGTNSRAGA